LISWWNDRCWCWTWMDWSNRSTAFSSKHKLSSPFLYQYSLICLSVCS
jgi:hypothetical protein